MEFKTIKNKIGINNKISIPKKVLETNYIQPKNTKLIRSIVINGTQIKNYARNSIKTAKYNM